MMPPKPKGKPRSFVAQDFRVPVDFRDQRPHQRLEHKLGAEGLLAWLTLQARVAVEAPSGRLEGWEDFDVCRAARWDGVDARLIEALQDARLIALVDDSWELVGWVEAQPYIAEAEARSQAATRAISIRWERARASASVPAEVRNDTARIRPVGLENTGGSSVVIPQPNHDQPNHDQPHNPPLPPLGGASADADHALGGDPGLRLDGVVPILGQQEARTGRYKSPVAPSDVQGDDKGIAWAPAELSTDAASVVDKSSRSWPEAFLAFWAAVPPKGRERSGRDKALKAWTAAVKEAGGGAVGAADLAESLRVWCASDAWTRAGGEYVPGIDRWLREGRWRDKPEPWTGVRPQSHQPWAARTTGFVSDDLKASLLARAQGDGPVVEAEVLP